MRSSQQQPSAPPPSMREALSYFFRLVALVRPYWGPMSRGLFLGMFLGTLGLIPPYVSKLYIDTVYPGRDVSLMQVLVLGVGVLTLTSTVMGALRGYYTQVITAKLGNAVSLMYFNHLQHLPMRFFDDHRIGEITSRLGDMRSALGAVARVFNTILVNGVYVILVPPFLVMLSWQLALLALVSTPITMTISIVTSRIIRRHMKQAAEASAELGAIQNEALSQIRTLKPMGVEHAIFHDAREQVDDVMRNQLRVAGLGSSVGVANAGVRAVATAVYTWYAWMLVLAGDLSLGSFFAFSAYLGYLTGPVSALAGLFTDFQQMSVSFGRAFEYLDIAPEQDPSNAYAAPARIAKPVRGEIAVDSVSFGYSPEQVVLRDVSVSFSPGTITAVVGQSGAGKSSLLRMLCRLVDPNAGTVRIDGVPVEHFPVSELRRQVGVVWQEPMMLRGTIWQNLTIGLDDVTIGEIDEAMRASQLESVIGQLPLRYETPIAEWGASMSGGQRQRFAIARALLRRTPILLLDEATSQVDVRTEEDLLRELFPRVRDKTVVFVTHRLATAALADRIVVMEGGRVIGEGVHQELSRTHPVYRAMLAAAELGDGAQRVRRLGVT